MEEFYFEGGYSYLWGKCEFFWKGLNVEVKLVVNSGLKKKRILFVKGFFFVNVFIVILLILIIKDDVVIVF